MNSLLGAPVTALVRDRVGGRLVDAVARDVTTTGVELVATHAPVVGASVSLVFFVNGEIVCAHGVVRWTLPHTQDHHAFGVSFSVIEDDGPSLLAAHCHASIS